MNKMNFLLEYMDYINSINELCTNDDIIMNHKLENVRLVEGLIKTYPVDLSAKIIKKRFPYLNIEIEDETVLFISNIKKPLKNYIPLFNNLGYYISQCSRGGNWNISFNDESEVDELELEPKYDMKIDIKNNLYHTCPIKYVDKILKYGLYPKSGNKISEHPDRIYLSNNLHFAHKFGKYLISEGGENGYAILEIDKNGLNNVYSDINAIGDGYYVLNNINPNDITLIGKY